MEEAADGEARSERELGFVNLGPVRAESLAPQGGGQPPSLCEQTFVGRADMAVRWQVGVEAPVGDSRAGGP